MEKLLYILVLIVINIICYLIFTKKIILIISKEKEAFENKKEEINQIIDSAEQMIFELNNISNYITTNIEEKKEILLKTIKKYDNKVETAIKQSQEIDDKIKTGNILLEQLKDINNVIDKTINTNQNNSKKNKNNKHIHIKDTNYLKALELAEAGSTVKEIAKELSIGQGEVQLLLGITELQKN